MSQSDTKKWLTAILTAGKGEEELYVRQSFPVWNKAAACEPVKHLNELFIPAFARGNACFFIQGNFPHNMQKSGFCSLLQAFVCVFIWKISGFSCVSTNLISHFNRSRLGMCYPFYNWALYKDVQLLSSENQTNSLLPLKKQTLLHDSNVIWEIRAFWFWWEWFMGETQQASLFVFLVLLKIGPMISITCCIWTC